MFKSSEKAAFILYLVGLAGLVIALIKGLPHEVWLTSFLWVGFCSAFLNEGFVHRYITHKSYPLARWKERLFSFLMTVSCAVGSPMGWAAMHRAHHKFVDSEKDPHSPHILSVIRLISFRLDYTGTMHSSKDFVRDKFQVFLHNYYLLLCGLWLAFVYFIAGVDWALGLVVIPWFVTVVLTGLVAYFGHLEVGWTSRPYSRFGYSVNSFMAWLFSYGAAGNHNTHHAKPWAWNTQEHWWDIDTAAWFIRLVRG